MRREDPSRTMSVRSSVQIATTAIRSSLMILREDAMAIADSIPTGQRSLTDQLRRAALSISLNIAEGNGRWHPKDRRNFFLIARGSAFECVPLLEMCRRRNWIEKCTHEKLTAQLESISKMLSGIVNKRN